MVCLHTRDYRSVGGFDLKIKGWGGEDVDLYTKHIKSKLKVSDEYGVAIHKHIKTLARLPRQVNFRKKGLRASTF